MLTRSGTTAPGFEVAHADHSAIIRARFYGHRAALIGGFDSIRQLVRQSVLGNFARKVGCLGCPDSEAAAKSMHDNRQAIGGSIQVGPPRPHSCREPMRSGSCPKASFSWRSETAGRSASCRGNPFSSSSAAGDSGIMCLTSAFMRSAGMVQVFASRSNSYHLAPRTSLGAGCASGSAVRLPWLLDPCADAGQR